MKITVGQEHVEWYNKETHKFHACMVLKHYESTDRYYIKLARRIGYKTVAGEELGVRGSLYAPKDWAKEPMHSCSDDDKRIKHDK